MSFILRQTVPAGVRFRMVLLPSREITIGRKSPANVAPTVEIELDSEQIGNQHARLRVNEDESECWITDLGSQYGTKINSNRIEAWTTTQLQIGDALTLGFDYQFTLEKSARPSGSYDKLTSVNEDVRLPINLLATERYVPIANLDRERPYTGVVPPGLALYSLKLINFLPEIYRTASLDGIQAFEPTEIQATHQNSSLFNTLRQDLLSSNTDFTNRLLALIESVLLPIEWTSTNFDLFLDVQTSPQTFLVWLEQWFMILTDSSWTEEQRRTFIQEANWLFERRGTKKALRRILEIYTGVRAEIVEAHEGGDADKLSAFEFKVNVSVDPKYTQVERAVVHKIVNAFKPAHTCARISYA